MAIGIIILLIAIALPVISSMRIRASRTQSLNLAKTVLTGTVAYSVDFRGYPPALFQPRRGTYLLDPPQVVTLGPYSVEGFWFYTTFMYHHLLRPTMPALEIYGPRTPETAKGTPPLWQSAQFYLSETLYASPEHWTAQVPDERLLRIQRLDDIRFPDRKGVVAQQVAYFERGGVGPDGSPMLLWSSTRLPGAVAWADMSTSMAVIGALEPGVSNPLDHDALINGGSSPGFPVIRTRNGVFGIDRSSPSAP